MMDMIPTATIISMTEKALTFNAKPEPSPLLRELGKPLLGELEKIPFMIRKSKELSRSLNLAEIERFDEVEAVFI